MEPCDVFPDDLHVAIAIEKIKAATTLPINHINNRWAGLRSFVRDKCLVAGFDPQVPGLFWLAGQGGYGIQTSPAMGRVCAGLVTGRGLPRDLVELGVSEAALSPARFASGG
jgi:D-arginine dehydrogenase